MMKQRIRNWLLTMANHQLKIGAGRDLNFSEEEWRMFSPTFSQYGEDLLLLRLWERRQPGGAPRPGFYVDVGAYDPVEFSNTNIFSKRGWRGLNVDLNPERIAKFQRLRPRDTSICCGVSKEPGEMVFCRYPNDCTNRLFPVTAQDRRNLLGEEPIDSVKVSTLPLHEILSRHLPAGQEIDLLDVDCEGLDLQVLHSNDWNKHRPALLAVEDLDEFLNAPSEDSEIVRYCRGQGYRLAASVHITRIFVREGD